MSKILFGRKLVLEALNDNASIEKVFIDREIRGEYEISVRNVCKERQIALKSVPKFKLEQLVKKGHQGIIAIASEIEYQNLEDIIPFLYENGKTPLILLLDRITDVRNLGAIARSAEIFGVDAIVYTTSKSAEINSQTVKISAGALRMIPVCRVASIMNTLDYLKTSGIKIIASVLEGEKNLKSTNFTEPVAIVIGSEDQGISPEVMKASDEVFKIDQIGKTDSLNASVATGIILYEVINQRKNNV